MWWVFHFEQSRPTILWTVNASIDMTCFQCFLIHIFHVSFSQQYGGVFKYFFDVRAWLDLYATWHFCDLHMTRLYKNVSVFFVLLLLGFNCQANSLVNLCFSLWRSQPATFVLFHKLQLSSCRNELTFSLQQRNLLKTIFPEIYTSIFSFLHWCPDFLQTTQFNWWLEWLQIMVVRILKQTTFLTSWYSFSFWPLF